MRPSSRSTVDRAPSNVRSRATAECFWANVGNPQVVLFSRYLRVARDLGTATQKRAWEHCMLTAAGVRYRQIRMEIPAPRRAGNHKKGHRPCPIFQALSPEASARKRLFRSQTNLTILSVWLKSLARRNPQILNGRTPRSTTGQPQTRLALRACSEAIL